MLKAVTRSLAAKKARLAEEEKGFTLIELLVVVIIIGILAAIAIPIFLGQQASARDSAVKSDITNAKTAIVALTVEGGTFPAAGDIGASTIAGFAPSADSKLKLVGTAASFCIEGYDVTNTATSTFHATDSSGVADGDCTP